MFRRLERGDRAVVRFKFDGRDVRGRTGDTVAAALLAVGKCDTRTTPARGLPRGPYCMMGVCFDCLMEIDGEANRQACQTIIRDGMIVRRQSGARQIGDEV